MIHIHTLFPEFEGDIVTEGAIVEEHSKDSSIFKVSPQGVFFPRHTEDVVYVMKRVTELKSEYPDLSVSVRAGGTCMTGGSLCSGIILNLTRYMNGVMVDASTKTATVSMGAYFRDIEREAGEVGLYFPAYPSSKAMCGIGGMIGNNASGEKSLRHGATIDNVLSLEVVLPNGEVIHTTETSMGNVVSERDKKLLGIAEQYTTSYKKHMGHVRTTSSGYRFDRILSDQTFNLTPLFVGAQGTLGIVTKAVIALVPIEEHPTLVVVPIDHITDIPFILHEALNHTPESVETFDIHTFERACLYLKESASKFEQYVHSTTSAWVLVEFTAPTQEESLAQAKEFEKVLISHSLSVYVISDEAIRSVCWDIRRHAFSLMRDNNEVGIRAVPCIEDAIVPIDQFSTFISELVSIIDSYKLMYAYHGHIGEGALRIIPLFDFREEAVADTIIAFTRDVITLIKHLGGNMSADHSDGIIRSPFLKEFYGDELYTVFTQIKELFDPLYICNPYKKIGGTESHIKQYIDR
jgi:FAD/FMN-containing dehydrogenase